jgi:hypothetical protein
MTTTDQPTTTAAPAGWYYRSDRAWVRVDNPHSAPRGVRVWAADELQQLPSGELAVRPAQEVKP